MREKRAERDKRSWEQLGQGSRDNQEVHKEEGESKREHPSLWAFNPNPTLLPTFTSII